MSDQEKKPREYFLNPKGTWIKVTPLVEQGVLPNEVHVIEISALKEAEAKLAEARALLGQAKDIIPAHHHECEDPYYSCPKADNALTEGKCTCGADQEIEFVAKLNEFLGDV